MHLLAVATLWVTALGEKSQPTDPKAPKSTRINTYSSPTDANGYSFETCPSIRQEVVLQSQEQSTATNISYRCHNYNQNIEDECTCRNTEAILSSFQNDTVIQSCCLLNLTSCSGCEIYKEGHCEKCLAGFYRMEDECVGCTNNALFIDVNGNTCSKYETEGYCQDGNILPEYFENATRRYQHLSAQEACCVCGGGSHFATPFEYRIRRSGGTGLVGERLEFVPYPRTATEYIASSDCNLASFGLNLHRGRGAIYGTPTHEKKFDVRCVITARSPKKGFQESVFNSAFREYNTTIKVSMRAFGITSADIANTRESRFEPVDTYAIWDDRTIEKVYKIRWSSAISADNPTYQFSCAPKTFVKFNKYSGTISLNVNSSANYKKLFEQYQGGAFPHDPTETPHGLDIIKSNCIVTAKDDTGVIHIVPLKIFAIPPIRREAIDFVPTSAIRVTVGQPVISKIQLGYPNTGYTKADKIPGLLTVRFDCNSSTGQPVEFDILKGLITMQDLPVAIVNTLTGELSGAPHVGLRQFMPDSSTRSYFTIACDVYAAVQSAPRKVSGMFQSGKMKISGGYIGGLRLIKASKRLVIQVDNDHCWVNAIGYTTSEGWYPVLDGSVSVSKPTAALCKSYCIETTSCAGYMFVGSSKMCHFLQLAPPRITLNNRTALKLTANSSDVAEINVDNCQIFQTCISVSISSQAYLSGLYCPLLSDARSEARPVFEKPGLHAEDTFYIMPFAKSDAGLLPKHCTKTNTAWVIRKASIKRDDIVDVEQIYLEMHGQIEACITSTILSGPENYTSSLLEFHNALVHVRSNTIDATDPQHSHQKTLEDPNILELTQDKVPLLSSKSVKIPFIHIKKNTLLGEVYHYPYFDLKFELKIWEQDLNYRSLLHFQKRGCGVGPGCRYPAIWIFQWNGLTRLHVRQTTTTHLNDGCDTQPVALRKWQKYQITLYPTNELQVKADGVLICNVKIGNVEDLYKVQLWASNRNHHSAFADIKNLEYDGYMAAMEKKVRVLPSDAVHFPLIRIAKDNIVGTFNHHPYFNLKFEMKINSQDHKQRSLFQFVQQGCSKIRRFCRRNPSIWIIKKNSKIGLFIRQMTTTNEDFGCEVTPLPLHKWQKYQITMYKSNYLKVTVNGVLMCNTKIGNVTNQYKVTLFAGNDSPDQAKADIRNFEYDSYTAANKVSVLPSGLIQGPAWMPIEGSRMLGIFQHNTYYDLKFEMTIWKQDGYHRSVLRFSRGCDRGPGCRHPAIWMKPDKSLHIRQSSTYSTNSGCDTPPISLHKWSKFQITFNPQNKLEVKVDGSLACNVTIGDVSNQGLLQLWVGGKFYKPALGSIKNLEYKRFPVSIPYPIYPSPSPTKSPLTITPTGIPTPFSSSSPTVSIVPRSIFDSVPFASVEGLVKGASEQAKIELSPMAKSCFSPIVGEDGRGEKSSTRGNNGKAEDTPKVETERELGEVKGGENVDRSKVFMFDDPATDLEFDYFLDPCECFFDAWGMNEPVTEEAFEKVNVESMASSLGFNLLIPEAFKLWEGPHICDLSYLLENTHESGSCAARCTQNDLCKYFAVAETSDGMACIMFSDCDHMLRVDTIFVATMYAHYRLDKGNDLLCHLADPKACWDQTRRRAYLTQKSQPFGTCLWQSLHEQCDFARLIGDTGIQYCAPCTYMKANSQKVKRAMPKAFPHGAKLEAACASEYQIITDKNAGSIVTCIDGEWRDNMGGVGLSNLQCAACVQVFDKVRNGIEMVSASMEELLYINNRHMQMFVFMGSEYPLWIETENYAIQLNAGTSRRYSWAIELDRTTSMILSTRVNHNDTRCLSVNTIQNNLSLQPCQVMHSINDTNTISILPSQVMHALSKKDYKDTGTLQTEETFSCRANNGILTQLGNDNCRPIYIRKTTDRQCIGTTRGFHIKCPKGHAMTNVSQRSALYTAKCAPLPAMGQCTQVEILYSMSNPSSENEIFRGVYYARQYYKHTHQALKCPAHMTIVEFSGERTSNIGSKLKLKCCFVPFYSGVKLADDPMQGFKSYEGLYCPTRYDDLLRLKFRQASSYGLSNLHSLVETAESVQIESYSKDVRLFESALEGKKKHYHTPPPTRHPTRYPSRFPTKQPTGFPTPSPTGFPTPYPKPNATRDHRGYISYRKTTNQWCLSYGPGTETCSRAHELDHPLLVDWIAEVKAGVRFSVTPVSLLQGEGMTASVGVPKAGAIDVPEKPQLIKFRSEEPEYDQGCIDIRSGKFSEAQQVFASTSSCGIVSSMTWNKDGDSNQQEGPGITNERMNDCFGREISRSWKEMTWEYGFNAASLTHRVFKSVIDYGCSQLPKPEFGVGGGLIPVYFGIKIPLPEICEYVSGAASDIAQYEREQKMRVKTRQLAKERYTDCNPTRIGIMRLLCDMHCLDDTVKSGAKAVLRQVKASNENILTNIDALMSYYAQLEMQKMTSEVNKLKSAQASSNQVNGLNPPGSVSSMTSRSMLLRLRDQMISNMEKYFDLGKEITQPKNGRLSHEALMGIVKANTEAQVALNNTLELLPTAQDSKTFVRKALEQIDARLTRGYKEALRVQRASAGRVDNFGRNMVAKRTARISVNLNISAALKSHLYDVKSAALALFHTRTKNIVNTVLELPTSTMHSSTGVIAWKIDQISNDVNFFRQEIEIHDLQETIGSLALQWGTVHAHVVEYLADAKRLTAMTQSILSEIQSYTTCGRDSSFIRRATYDFNQIHERAAKTLKNAWPEVVRAAVAHMQTYAIENVPRRSIHASFASLRIPATQFASEYLTVSGVQKARALLEKQLDGLPFDMTHQAVALLTQVSFLRSSMITTDFNPTQHEIEQATAAYRTLSAITQTQIGALANNRHVLALFSQVLDAQLVTVAPAPGSCRQIAFDRFNDPQAASFVTLSSFNTANLSPNVTSAFVVSPPLSRLLSVFDIDQEIEISKAFSFENHAAASLLLRSVHVCAREQSLSPPGTRWTLQRAIDMPQGAGVKFCTGKACIGAAKGAIHVATRDEAEKAVDLTGTALLKLVRTAFY